VAPAGSLLPYRHGGDARLPEPTRLARRSWRGLAHGPA
jgi:hypothetical protein